jgi:hypothetical protein
VFSARAASANGRYPAANQVVVAPSDPQTLLLRATFDFLRHSERDPPLRILRGALGVSGRRLRLELRDGRTKGQTWINGVGSGQHTIRCQ